MSTEYPIEEIKLPFGSTYMNIIKVGSAPKIFSLIAGVSLTGLEGQGGSIASAYKKFLPEYTIYVFERKKFLSPTEDCTSFMEDIYSAMKQLKIEKTFIMGASQGGMIAQLMAIHHPEIVEKIVLCSSACRPNQIMKDCMEKWYGPIVEKNVVELNRIFFKTVYGKEFLEKFKEMLPTLEKIGTAEDCVRMKVLVDACKNFDTKEKLKEIKGKVEMLVIGSEDDLVLGKEASEELAETLGCKKVMYRGYGHAVYDECDDVKEKIYEFFK